MAVAMTSGSYNVLPYPNNTIILDSGTSRYLLLFVAGCTKYYDHWDSIVVNGVTVSSPIFNVLWGDGSYGRIQGWGLPIPDGWSGTITYDTYLGTNKVNYRHERFLFTGVNPYSPIYSTYTNTGNSASISGSLVGISTGYVQDRVIGTEPFELVAGANQTSDWIRYQTGEDTNGSSHYTTPTSGATTMSWTLDKSTRYAHGIVSLNPYSSPVTDGDNMSPMWIT